MIWIITDTHFGHDAMIEYCNRPKDFSYRILQGLLAVKEEDVLIHLGDICIGDDLHWHNKLQECCDGKMWLVLGNHDSKSISWYLKNGWDCVCNELLLDRFGKRILFTHASAPHGDHYDLNLHGHGHITSHHPDQIVSPKHKLLFVEHDYRPVPLEKLIY